MDIWHAQGKIEFMPCTGEIWHTHKVCYFRSTDHNTYIKDCMFLTWIRQNVHVFNQFCGQPTYHPEYTNVHPLLCAVCSCPLWWGHSQLQRASGRTEWWGHSCPLPHLPPPPAYMSAGCHLGAGTWQQPYAYLWCTQWMQPQSCMGCLTQQLSYGSVLTCNKMGHITCKLHEEKFHILVTTHLGIILMNNQLDVRSFIHIYFDSLHVSGNLVLIIRTVSCINTSGVCYPV